MEKVILDNAIERVIQERKTEQISEVRIDQFEDNGTDVKVRTNIGVIRLYSGEEYPRDGIFNLTKADIITKLKAHLSKKINK